MQSLKLQISRLFLDIQATIERGLTQKRIRGMIRTYSQMKLIEALREKCPNVEFFLVRIFLYSDLIQRFTYLRIQSEYRKIRTGKNYVFGHFSRSEVLLISLLPLDMT